MTVGSCPPNQYCSQIYILFFRDKVYVDAEKWEIALSVYQVFERKSLFVLIDQESHSLSIVFSLTSAVQISRARFAYSQGDYF